MINRIKTLIHENRVNHKKTRLMLQEQVWANVYHDSIRGYDVIERLPLNIGRWAGGYAFFYVLHRILQDYKPETILEFGLGESSKFISTSVDHYLKGTTYHIIEENEEWLTAFQSRFTLTESSQVKICPLEENSVKGFSSRHYKGFKDVVTQAYQLYVVDGPFGSPRYSRYDIMHAITYLGQDDDFIIILDDCNRIGEQDTLSDMLKDFKARDIEVHCAKYQGLKIFAVVASKKYKFIKTM